mmetsp:Transcript_12183/g.39126  ORF Transcript_12183/g.39126 Transcript_12183/m.39126 type:complete len:212 (+) Transcript_12183:187-822(+)
MHNNATTALQTNSRSRVGRARQATEARTSLPAPRRRRLRHPLTLGRPRTRARGVGLRRDGPEPECGCSSDGVDQRRQLRPFTAEQLMRPARLGAPPRVHHKDPVVVDNRVQPVCNGEQGHVGHVRPQGALDAGVGRVVDGRGGLVQQQHGWRAERGPGEAQKLTLAHGPVCPAFLHQGVETALQGQHGLTQTHRRERSPELVVRVGAQRVD